MKTISFLGISLFSVLLDVSTTVRASAVPAPTPWTVVSRRADSAVWQRQTYEQGRNGTVITNTHRYVELASGLNHLVGGQWVPSSDQISISADGTSAYATNGQQQAFFPGNIYDGAIKVVTADGKVLQSQPIGLAYSDGSNSVLLAVVTNATGAILSSGNEVIYTNAFAGLDADLLYTYTIGGFEQDVVLREQPPEPSSLGLNPATTRLEMLTEFIGAPTPGIRETTVRTAAGNLEDDHLNFGAMIIGRGKAFVLGSKSPLVGVEKRWLKLQGRQFLIEEVPIVSLAKGIDSLPPYVSQAGSTAKAVVSKNLILPARRLVRATPKTTFLAQAASPDQGLVLDYVTLNTDTNNFTFQDNTTYYISSTINLTGTTTIEGGAVIKCGNNGELDASSGTVVCDTAAYHPAIFTSMNDNSVGETIGGSSGSPSPFDVQSYLSISSGNPLLHDLRFSYGSYGIDSPSAAVDVWNCQFLNLYYPIYGGDIGLHNVLIGGDQEGYSAIDLTGNLVAENVTADTSGFVWVDSSSGATVALTNCLLTGEPITTGSGPATLATNSAVFNAVFPFRAAGGGSYYLAYHSHYLGAGTTNINLDLLTELRTKTTWPPVVYSHVTISTNLTLSPQAPRDNQGGVVDIGYHYDPIDYEMTAVNVTNGTLTVTPGTVVGINVTTNSLMGLQVYGAGQITCQGTAGHSIRFVSATRVQEEASEADQGVLVNASCAFEFTKFFTGQQEYPIQLYDRYTLQNCEFHGGNTLYPEATQIVNCLFLDVYDIDWFGAADNSVLRNNTFVNCGVIADYNLSNGTDVVADNLFDLGGVANWTSYGVTGGHNAFYESDPWGDPFSLPGDGDLPSAPGFQRGPLGNYYLSPNCPYLVNYGDTTAAALGLDIFTTQTNQTPDSGTVDIGYHYPIPGDFSSLGTNFWVAFMLFYTTNVSLYIASPGGATGTVAVQGGTVIVTNCGDLGLNGTYVLTNPPADFINNDPDASSPAYVRGTNWVYRDVLLRGVSIVAYNSVAGTYTILYTNSESSYSFVGGSGYWQGEDDPYSPPITFFPTNSLPFTLDAGAATNISLPWPMEGGIYGVSNGIEVTASAPVAVYGATYGSGAYGLESCSTFTVYPTPLLGTNYYLMDYAMAQGGNGLPIEIVAAQDDTHVTVEPSADSAAEGGSTTNVTLQQGQRFEPWAGYDATGTRVISDKPVAVFPDNASVNVPENDTSDYNVLGQEQPPVEDWGTYVVSLGFAGRTNGDTYRVLAAYSNTVVRITGTVVTVQNWGPPAMVTKANETLTLTLTNGEFTELILDGPAIFQANNPIQVAHFANGTSFDEREGNPTEILLPPVGHYLETNLIVVLPNDGVNGNFDHNYLNLYVPQSATNSTFVDGSLVLATNFMAIGSSGYYGAQITGVANGTNTVTSSQPVGVEVYGWGNQNAYGYFGGMVK